MPNNILKCLFSVGKKSFLTKFQTMKKINYFYVYLEQRRFSKGLNKVGCFLQWFYFDHPVQCFKQLKREKNTVVVNYKKKLFI